MEKLEKYVEAIDCVDRFEQWIKRAVHPHKSHKVAAEDSLQHAFLVKSRCRNELGQHEEALEAFDLSANTLDDIVEDMDTRARATNILLRRVKILVDLKRQDEAMELFDEISRRVNAFDGPMGTPEMVMALGFTLQYVKNGPDWFDKAITTQAGGSPDPS